MCGAERRRVVVFKQWFIVGSGGFVALPFAKIGFVDCDYEQDQQSIGFSGGHHVVDSYEQ